MKVTFALAAATFYAIIASPVWAQPLHQDSVQVLVSYADLNLASPTGRDELQTRVDAAIRKVCPPADPRDLEMQRNEVTCRAQATDALKPQLAMIYRQPTLTQAAAHIADNRL